MKRRLAVLSTVLVSGVLFVVLVVLVLCGPGRAPETWQTALERYLDYQAEIAGNVWAPVAADSASDPVVFDASMSLVSYGRGVVYQTDATYARETPTPGVFGVSPRLSRRPVLYPPTTVWCVLLSPGDEASGASCTMLAERIVFVALHQDLYNAAWIVHEAEVLPLSSDFKADLVSLGCEEIAARP